MIDRRHFTLGAGAALLLPGCTEAKPPKPAKRIGAVARLAAIERTAGGRLGAFVLDTASGQGEGWRAGDRFGMCSSFKLSLAALALREAAAGRAQLDEQLAYTRADLLSNSPETEKHVGEGRMSIAALAEAAQIFSDNCAANLLLKRFGGPAGLTRFWREIGDKETRLDRFEPELNRVPPGELRDTTTPEAMARGVARFLLGDVLAPADSDRLRDWMARTATGARRIRAGVPPDWRSGDKTGTASYKDLATRINDIAVLYPPNGRAPLIVTAFYETSGPTEKIKPEDEAVLKQVGEAAVQWAS